MTLYRQCPCRTQPGECHPWHYKFEHDGRRYRGTTRMVNRHKAEQVAATKRAKVLDGSAGLLKRKAPFWSAHAVDYLNWARGDHPATADLKDAAVLAFFQQALGDQRLDRYDAFDAERWRTKRRQVPTPRGTPLSRATLDRELSILRGVFTKAVAWKRLRVSPFTGVPNLVGKQEIPPVRTLTMEERAVVLQQLPFRDALICRVTLECLARLSEVLNLKREDLKAHGIQRRLKGGTHKVAHTTPTLLADLRAQLVSPTQRYVFGDPPATAQVQSSRFAKLFAALGLDISHHVMRHTGVTDMLDDGVNPRVIQELAGWTSLQQLARYGHVRDQEMARAVAGTAARNTEALRTVVPDMAAEADKAAIKPAIRPQAKVVTR